KAVIDSDLVEWNYGECEELTPKQIHEATPDWLIFRDGCPGGETPDQVGARVDRVIVRSRAGDRDGALFGHGARLRGLGARGSGCDSFVGWLGAPGASGLFTDTPPP